MTAIAAIATLVAPLAASAQTARSAAPKARAATPAPAPAKAAVGGLGRGLMIGVSGIVAPGLKITGTGEDEGSEIETKLGAGAGLQVGYGFNQRFMAFATLDIAKQDSKVEGLDGNFGYVTIEVGGRMNLSAAGGMTPYVLAAVGQRAIGAEVTGEDGKVDVSLSGMVVDVGGGLQWPLSPKLALDSEVRLGFGKFGNYEEDGDEIDIEVKNTLSPRLRVGLSWYPMAR
jgi:hypothetical protein